MAEEDGLVGRENNVPAVLCSELGSRDHLTNNSVVGHQGQGGGISIPYVGAVMSTSVF